MQNILVFCGSSAGSNPVYRNSAQELGAHLAQNGYTLIYGAGKVGLMGVLADAALQHGGKVIGIIPKFLSTKEVVHSGLTELITVDTMAERKTIMLEKADASITLPGGFGTLDELFEMLTEAQLGRAEKPVGLLNIDGYFDQLIGMISHMVNEEFLKIENQNQLITATESSALLSKMQNYSFPKIKKWL